MDEELLNLFLTANQGNKNVSSTLGNMDNPFLVYLAGQYNPLAAMGSAGGAGGVGPMGSRYAGNEKYPAVNEILNEIATGADEFQVATKAKALVAAGNVDGFDSIEFEKLARELYKESKGGDEEKKTVWQKAGLSDPTELYTSENVPLPDVAGQRMAPIQSRMDDALKLLTKTKNQEKSKAFDSNMSAYDFLANTDEGRALAESEGIDLDKVDRGYGDVYTWRGTQRKKRSVFDPRNLTESISSTLFRTAEDVWDTARGKKDDPKNRSINYNPRISDAMERKAMASRLAQSERIMAELDVENAEKEAQAYRQGVADYKIKQGKTPLDDQLAGVMRFLSQNR